MCPRSNVKLNLMGEVRLGLSRILQGINCLNYVLSTVFGIVLFVLFRKDDCIIIIIFSLGHC